MSVNIKCEHKKPIPKKPLRLHDIPRGQFARVLVPGTSCFKVGSTIYGLPGHDAVAFLESQTWSGNMWDAGIEVELLEPGDSFTVNITE